MRLLVTTIGGVALAGLALAPAASGWTSPRHLDAAAQAPIYSSDSHGRFYALFARTDGPDYQLFFDRLGRKGGRSPGERVDNDGTAPGGGNYALAMAPSGRAVAVYCSPATSNGSPGVYAALRRPGGRFGAPQEIEAPAAGSGVGDTCQVTAAAGSSGGLVASWRLTGSGRNVLRAATATPGAAFGPAQDLATNATGRSFPTEAGVDARGRATVAWLTRGRVFAARQSAAGGAFSVRATPGRACDFGARPIRLQVADGGAAALLSGRCVGRGRHVLRLARAAAASPFGHTQRIGKTRYSDSRLVANAKGRLLVTWRSGSGQLIADTGTIARGIRHRRQLTHGRVAYRDGVDAHSSAIAANGRAVVAWRQRSLRRHARVNVRLADSQGRFARRGASFRAPGATGVDVAMDAGGAAAVAFNRPRRRGGTDVDQIVATTRRPGRRFDHPRIVVRGSIEPVGLLASGNKVLLTWVTQPDLDALSSVGHFHGRRH